MRIDARSATIGRFEATLARDVPQGPVVRSGIPSLDWRDAVRVPLEPEAAEGKLHVRLFDDVDREFTETVPAGSVPFLGISRDGNVMVLRADSMAEP
jgi:hypothetical protein